MTQDEFDNIYARIALAIQMIERAQWLEQHRNDVLNNLKCVQFLLKRITKNGS